MFKFRVLNVMISVQRFPRILCCMCRPNKVIQGKIVSSRWKNTTYLAILVPVTPGAAEEQTHCCEDECERRHYCIQTTLRPPTLKWPGYICKRIETNNLYWLQSSISYLYYKCKCLWGWMFDTLSHKTTERF